MKTMTLPAAALLVLAVTGCATGEGTGGTPPPGDLLVEVTLSEFAIEMPDSAPAGEVTFDISNEGDMAHSFVIEGEGVDEQLDQALDPTVGEILTVELEPGTYTVWCPIGDHRDRGMEAQIEITESARDDGAPLGDEAIDPSDQPEELDAGG